MRNGFNLLMAIAMILILAGAATLTMKYVKISAKHISDSFLKEQAQIYAQSALEAAIIQTEEYNRSANDNCYKGGTVDLNDARFRASVSVRRYYIYDGKDNFGEAFPTSCGIDTAIKTEESHGYTIIEVVVETNSSHPKVKNFTSPVRIVSRSIQRP